MANRVAKDQGPQAPAATAPDRIFLSRHPDRPGRLFLSGRIARKRFDNAARIHVVILDLEDGVLPPRTGSRRTALTETLLDPTHRRSLSTRSATTDHQLDLEALSPVTPYTTGYVLLKPNPRRRCVTSRPL